MSRAFHIEWQEDESSRSVRVLGEIDLATAGQLREALACDRRRLDVDLSNVDFMDLSGLNCLLDALDQYDVVSLRTNPRVERLLELTATSHLFSRR